MADSVRLEKSLGLLDATTIVMGSMIGSGVFIVAADISRQVMSPGLMLVTWVVTAVLTIIGALSYGELAAAMPRAGGQYVYLREAYGPMVGFLYGWTLFLVIQTGTIAAVAVAFAKYAGVIFPMSVSMQQWLGIAIVVLLSWVNSRGVRFGAVVQNVFTIAKVGTLLALVVFGFAVGRSEAAVARNFGDFWGASTFDWTSIRLVGVAMVGSLFSSDAWNNVTFTGSEIRKPERNLPLALVLGVSVVSLLYMATNYVYLLVLPFEAIQSAPQDRVATAAVSSMLGSGAAYVMAAAIMVSTFGCINGMVMSGARVYYAMAKDGLFFKSVSRIDPVSKTPRVSLLVQCIAACILTLSGKYGDLLDYVIFAVLLFYILTIAGILVLRSRRPEMERPYRALGYPVLPVIYILLAGLLEILLLLYKPSYTWPGLMIVLLGIPVYFFWTFLNRRKEVKA
jgi:APA family basic amino acid/polyamine antiporter